MIGMNWSGNAPWWIMAVCLLALVVLALSLLVLLGSQYREDARDHTPEEILEMRRASGEISEREYRQQHDILTH